MVPDNGPYGFERDEIAPRGCEVLYVDCVFTFCGRKQGLGTWADLKINGHQKRVPVCEEHWKVLRGVR